MVDKSKEEILYKIYARSYEEEEEKRLSFRKRIWWGILFNISFVTLSVTLVVAHEISTFKIIFPHILISSIVLIGGGYLVFGTGDYHTILNTSYHPDILKENFEDAEDLHETVLEQYHRAIRKNKKQNDILRYSMYGCGLLTLISFIVLMWSITLIS